MSDVFDQLAATWTTRDGVSRSTMMGFPCLRRRGAFFACIERGTDKLIVKLPRERVAALVVDGVAEPFAPAGKVFREWARVVDDASWDALLEEAWAFAG